MTRRVLILFPGSLGDFLCVLPALKVIGGSRNEQSVNVGVRGGALEIARAVSFIDRCVSLDGGPFARLFSSSVENQVDVDGVFSSIAEIFSWFGHSSPAFRVNLGRLVSGPIHSFPFFSGQEKCHASAYYLRCVGVDEIRCPSLVVREAARKWAGQYWQRQGWNALSRVLVIQPGSGGRKKRWCRKGFQCVARWWRSHKQAEILILLGPAEEYEAHEWQDFGQVEINVSLSYVAGLLARADLFLGNDAGVSHLAGAVGARGVVIFGPTHPEQWRPLGGSLSVVRNERYRTVNPDSHGISLAEIPAEFIITQLSQYC